ncbi:hypothetical protein MMC20_001838 [Loxospora ochrophaea]|nr:hypothetical protein [Loxospora ochrophaea]
MPSSLINDITSAPHIPDPLPRYTRDPEIVSIRSSAPSYVSEAPTYHSSLPAHHRSRSETTGLRSPTYAPGFYRGNNARAVSDVTNHNYNISGWSSVTSGHQARHYQNVAHRRAQATMVSAEEANAIAAVMSSPTRSTFPTTGLETYQEDMAEDPSIPISPLEDPDLVGAEAAERAKTRRLYIARCNDEEALRQENKTWDFMLAQMADWKEREKSWDKFRRDVGNSRLLGRRIGLRRGRQ